MQRVKVKVQHKRNVFYRKYLEACRDATEDRHQQYSLYKAICGLRNYPLEATGINDLKQIHGIGEAFATRCEAAWTQICFDKRAELTLNDVLELTQEDFNALLQNPRKNFSPLKNSSDEPSKKKSRKHDSPNKSDAKKKIISAGQPSSRFEDEFNESSNSTQKDDCNHSSLKRNKSTDSNADENFFETNCCGNSESQQSNSAFDERYITCKPSDQAEVILICDAREDRKKKFGYNVVELLQKNNSIRVETRVLSVGDFLWIARKIEGSELVLDWVVERKTWEDLQSSILHGRYDEQKQRLQKAPINNKVYLLEDRGKGSVATEQALSTTRTRDGFLIQRCMNGKETAMFLESVTHRLTSRLRKETIIRVSFDYLQQMSEKGQAATVQNIWIQQLTVCPGMSSYRAEAVAESFPTFASLANYYTDKCSKEEDPSEALSKTVPQIPKAVAVRMSKYFLGELGLV